jgi:hypothetical protein
MKAILLSTTSNDSNNPLLFHELSYHDALHVISISRLYLDVQGVVNELCGILKSRQKTINVRRQLIECHVFLYR